jgi:hypothetical protein
MSPSVTGIVHALRRRPAPGVIVLVIALVGAFFVSRSCQRDYVRISEEQAVALGERQLDFDPQGHSIRMVLRGVPPKRHWAVSYFIRRPSGDGFRKLTVLLIDANTGKVQLVEGRP